MPQQASLSTEAAEAAKDAVAQPEQENTDDRLKVLITYLIAGISLLGAFMAWWATDIEPADFNREGLQAVLNAETTQTLNTAALYKSYRAYTNFTLTDELRRQVEVDMADMHPRERVGLEQQQAQMARIAPIQQRFFPQRYLNRDGSYNIERQLGEAWAQAGQTMDLNAQQHFEQARLEQVRIYKIAAMVFGLTVALLFYTIATGLHPQRVKLRYGAALLGLVSMLASIGSFVMAELLK